MINIEELKKNIMADPNLNWSSTVVLELIYRLKTQEQAVMQKLREQKPVAWVHSNGHIQCDGVGVPTHLYTVDKGWKPLFENPAPSAPEWKPIETAPKSLKSILLSGDRKIADGYWGAQCNKGKGDWVWPYVRTEPTHWMPLPKPPMAAARSE